MSQMTESEVNMTEKPGNNFSDRKIMVEETAGKATETFQSENRANSYHLEEDEETPRSRMNPFDSAGGPKF